MEYDIVFIEGNKKYLTDKDHDRLRNKVLSGLDYNIKVVQSDDASAELPKAKVYIGFSQGTRYMRRIEAPLKISIGGIGAKDVITLKNPNDKVRQGDTSKESLEAHFTVTDQMKRTIDKYVKKALK
jgi:hypothetical protein